LTWLPSRLYPRRKVRGFTLPKIRLPGSGGAAETRGPTLLVTNLCVMRLDPHTHEFTVTFLHPGVSRDQVRESTGWELKFAERAEETLSPGTLELGGLRGLNLRTRQAHGNGVV
jgi:hypothetical protein